jgi:hypothetical protein
MKHRPVRALAGRALKKDDLLVVLFFTKNVSLTFYADS